MSANDRQIGGEHYQKGEVQHWDWAANLRYLEGNATKYLGRHRDKEGIVDINKALHYIEKIVETDYPEYELVVSLRLKTEQQQHMQNPYANIAPHD